MNKTQEIGYKPLMTQKPNDNLNSDNLAEIDDKLKNNHFDEYYKLLNGLEMPLVPVSDLIYQKMNMICGQSIKNNLPEIPNLYQNLIIPVLPGNIPIMLFNESSADEENNQNENLMINKFKEDNSKVFRNTTNLILPQFENNGGQWPKTSPYACWNCDTFFDGTPWGMPEKEVDGKFYCYGNVCSAECSARYLVDHETTADFWMKYSLLCIIYQKAYSLPPDTKVSIAAPRESLFKYGGKFTYNEYHEKHKHDKIIEIYKLPLIPVLLHIEEISKSTNINSIIEKNNLRQFNVQTNKNLLKTTKHSRFIPIDPQKLIKAEENLKQKTQERLQSNFNLDDCFLKQPNC